MLLEQALLFFPLILGCYISYHILKITDLSIDGTYVLGAAVFARTINFGIEIAIILTLTAGVLIGLVVGYMQKNNVVNDLLVGILVNFMLYSVNLQVMQRPNISLIGKSNLLSLLNLNSWVLPLLIIMILISTLYIIFIKSEYGLILRAFGHNQELLKTLGKSTEKYRLLGLSCSGSLAALAGALNAQYNGFADINMGFGVALVSIGSVVIGLHLLKFLSTNFSAIIDLIAIFLGILTYYSCLNLFLYLDIDPANFKLMIGLTLFIALSRIYKFNNK